MILNIGGIANVSVLPGPDDQVFGFDTGPGNTLMDQWYRKHKGGSYDPKGRLGCQWLVNTELLGRLLGHPIFTCHTPKARGEKPSPCRGWSCSWPNGHRCAPNGSVPCWNTARSITDAIGPLAIGIPEPETV